LAVDMHILVMTRSTLSHGFGGFQRQCIDLCEGFVQLGHNVTVLTTAHPDGIDKEEQSGFTVYFLTPSRPRTLSRSWFRESKRAIEEIHRKSPIDVIHSNQFAALGVISWANRRNIPIAVVCHGSFRTGILSFFSSADRRPRYWHWLLLTPMHILKRTLFWEIPLRRNASSIILVSPTLKRDFNLFSRGKVKVIENGINLPNIREPNVGNSNLRLLCTGRAEREKGFHLAIRAVSEITELDLHLDLVGTGAYLDELHRLVDNLELNDRVTFHGRVDDDELSRIYSSADVYLLPTIRHEGLPLALLEAMAHGLPPIASHIGGNTDVITHEHDGLFVGPGSLDELVTSIRRLGADSHFRISLSKATRKTAERRFDKERMVIETVEILSSIS
jgi:glycosyltransferase involved in cell wall biosynthesis